MRVKALYLSCCLAVFIYQKNIFSQSNNLQSPFSIETFCQSYHGQSDFLKELEKKILSHNEKRILLVKFINDKKALGCKNAIEDYLNKFAENNSLEKPADFKSYLILAFSSNLKIATKIIENEISRGSLLDWIDVLEEVHYEAYFETLSKWVSQVAQVLRKHSHAQLMEEKLYGKNIIESEDIKTPESIPIWNPIFISKYMAEVISKKEILSQSDFANLNIIFAASNQSYREIFLNQMSTIVGFSEANWLKSFRVEPSWVEFRLFPIMKKVGGGAMKRELIWLSNNHENFKIRSMAETTLEKLNGNYLIPQ